VIAGRDMPVLAIEKMVIIMATRVRFVMLDLY